MYRAVATCAFGVESVLSFELRHLGMEDVEVHDGRVFFSADKTGIAKANIWLRTAERVLIVLGEYTSSNFDELFDGAYAADWALVIGKNDAFPVKGFSMNSKLTSVPACQSVLKKAIVEKLKKQYGTQTLPETSTEKKVRFSITKDKCTLMLDTSGDGLHKRGYRPLLNEAPIKETLAAAIVDFSRCRDDSTVMDPFCGSGTLLIEAAMRAKNIAPGLNRHFAAEFYDFIGRDTFDAVRKEAKEQIKTDISFHAYGSDLETQAVSIANENAKRAGVSELCDFSVADARQFVSKPGSIILANPPYGERLSTPQEAEDLMRDFGKQLADQDYRSLYVISSLPDFERIFGRTANRRRKLYNGMLPCQLFMYY
ncbi:MAG: class I SAM-dependent RNA methyltransferase [Oscillospiraceae bacterium]|nr:class I SAM-dependent RNA methyltransferase [Oscillospiraceae bacterium]